MVYAIFKDGVFRPREPVRAIEKNDVDASEEAHRAMFASCKQCHDVYKKH